MLSKRNLKRESARAIIFDDQGRLLVFERERRTFKGLEHYYSIPGGGIDEAESPEDAVVRELKEEMMITIKVDRYIAYGVTPRYASHYFLASIVDGTPVFNPDSEEATHPRHAGSYQVRWVDMEHLSLPFHSGYSAFISQLQKWIRSGSFPDKPVDIV